MQYRNWSRVTRKERSVQEISDSSDGVGTILRYEEDEPVELNKQSLYLRFDEEKMIKGDKAYEVVYIDGNSRKNILDRFHNKEDAEDYTKKILKDITQGLEYRAKLMDKIHFELRKSGLGQEEEVVEETTIDWNSSNRSEVMDKYFHTDEERVMEDLRGNGVFAETVGQGLFARAVAK